VRHVSSSLLLLCFVCAVCPAGTYELGSRCVRCPIGFYCPAGTGNDVAANISVGSLISEVSLSPDREGLGGKRSFQIACGDHYTTRFTGSKDQVACGKPRLGATVALGVALSLKHSSQIAWQRGSTLLRQQE
jgi:hypothetical protein